MKNLMKFLEDLFSQSEKKATSSVPFLHEPLEIDASTEEELKTWTGSLRMRRLFDWLHAQYNHYRQDNVYDNAIDFLNLPSSKGFVIHLDQTSFELRDMELLLHYLKKQVLELGYKSSVSDQRSFEKASVIHNVLRHYLKPKIRPLGQEKSDQKFGNITIELVEKNDEPAQFLFSASTYSDHKYHDAEPFSDLMKHIMKTG